MWSSQFQYTSNQNQFQKNYDERKTSGDIKLTFVVLSHILAREKTFLCMTSDEERRYNMILHEQPVCTSYFHLLLTQNKYIT